MNCSRTPGTNGRSRSQQPRGRGGSRWSLPLTCGRLVRMSGNVDDEESTLIAHNAAVQGRSSRTCSVGRGASAEPRFPDRGDRDEFVDTFSSFERSANSRPRPPASPPGAAARSSPAPGPAVDQSHRHGPQAGDDPSASTTASVEDWMGDRGRRRLRQSDGRRHGSRPVTRPVRRQKKQIDQNIQTSTRTGSRSRSTCSRPSSRWPRPSAATATRWTQGLHALLRARLLPARGSW